MENPARQKCFGESVIYEPKVTRRSWPLSPASSQSSGGQPSCFSCCVLVTRAENSSCSVSVTLDTPGDIWKSASVCLGSGFQFSGPGSFGMQTGLPWPWRVRQSVFTTQISNNLSKSGEEDHLGLVALGRRGSTRCKQGLWHLLPFQPFYCRLQDASLIRLPPCGLLFSFDLSIPTGQSFNCMTSD